MSELTKDKLRAMRADLDAALAGVAKKHGLAALIAGNVTYEPTGTFTWKLQGRMDGALAKEQQRYDDNRWLGLPKRGSTFQHNGHTETTWGLNTNGRKVITERDDGKRFLWPVDAIKRLCPEEVSDADAAAASKYQNAITGADPKARDQLIAGLKKSGAA